MTMSGERRRTVTALHAAFRAGEINPSDHLDSCLDLIVRENPKINAVVALCEDRARAAAIASDRRFAAGRPLGLLDGITVGIKDTFDVAGVPTTHGSPLFADSVPECDCLAVSRLDAAGAIIVGKTNTSEFAAGAHTTNELFGPTRNPWDTERSPGGSTGGGAAGVASGMFDVALGSDLGGSLRVPAAFCGVFGLRPTPGLIAKSPDLVPFDIMSVDGVIGSAAMDLALSLDVLATPDPDDPKSPPPDWHPRVAERLKEQPVDHIRVAYSEEFCGVEFDAQISAMCRAALQDVQRCDFQPQIDLSEGRAAYLHLRAKHILDANRHLLDRIDLLGLNLSSNIREGITQEPTKIAEAETVRSQMWRSIAELFGKFDVLCTPCTTVPPFEIDCGPPTSIKGEEMRSYIDWIAPTFLFSMLGLPGLSVPVGIDDRGLPVGLQVIGPRYSEAKLLSVADHLTKVSQHH